MRAVAAAARGAREGGSGGDGDTSTAVRSSKMWAVGLDVCLVDGSASRARADAVGKGFGRLRDSKRA